ncbi:MAG TPA: hypothetical protein DCQ98_14765 [Planctomycetaceae bacterium]|nr:hypothetical protein [Planctomycetaceae bacterium]
MDDPMSWNSLRLKAAGAALILLAAAGATPAAAMFQGPLTPPDDRGQVGSGQPLGAQGNNTQVPVESAPAGPTPFAPSDVGQTPLHDPNTPLPCPFPPLDERHEAYVRQLLEYWENSTNQVERFHCKFNRWDYDPVFGPAPDPTTGKVEAAAISTGEIKFEGPDKAAVEVTGRWLYTPATAEEQAQYKEAGPEQLERYVTDGRYAFEFDYTTKQVRKRELPPEIRGTTIADGPIPFIFGAKADRMLARYWIRVITPEDAAADGQYWLEAYPKYLSDASNFSRVRVVLNGDEFLPIAMEVFDPQWDEVRNFRSQSYQFEERVKNPSQGVLFLQRRPFYDPEIPRDWTLIDMPLRADVATPVDPAAPPIR